MVKICEKRTIGGNLISVDNGFFFDPDFLHSCSKDEAIQLYAKSKTIINDTCKHYQKRREVAHPIANNKFLYNAFVFEVFCMLNNLYTYAAASKPDLTKEHINDCNQRLSLQRNFIKNFKNSSRNFHEIIDEYPCFLESAKTSHVNNHKFNLLYNNIIDISHGTDSVKYWYEDSILRIPSSLIFQIFFTRLNLLITLTKESTINSKEKLLYQNISELSDLFALISVFIDNEMREIKNADEYSSFLNTPKKCTSILASIKAKLRDHIKIKGKIDFTSKKILSHFYDFYADPSKSNELNLNQSASFIFNCNLDFIRNFFIQDEFTNIISPDLAGFYDHFDLFDSAYMKGNKEDQNFILNSPSDSILTSLGRYLSLKKHNLI